MLSFVGSHTSRDQFAIPQFRIDPKSLSVDILSKLDTLNKTIRDKYKAFSPINIGPDGTYYVRVHDFKKQKLEKGAVYKVSAGLHKYVKPDTKQAYFTYKMKSCVKLEEAPPSNEQEISWDDL